MRGEDKNVITSGDKELTAWLISRSDASRRVVMHNGTTWGPCGQIRGRVVRALALVGYDPADKEKVKQDVLAGTLEFHKMSNVGAKCTRYLMAELGLPPPPEKLAALYACPRCGHTANFSSFFGSRKSREQS